MAATLLAFAAAGFANVSLASHLAAAPRIPGAYGVGAVEGYVVDVSSPSADRGRLLIAPTSIAHIDPPPCRRASGWWSSLRTWWSRAKLSA